jgi:hypothetical protein
MSGVNFRDRMAGAKVRIIEGSGRKLKSPKGVEAPQAKRHTQRAWTSI